MRKIWPFSVPWPFVIMALKRLRNSFTMTPESRPVGGVRAVTAEPGELAEKMPRPRAVAADRVASARSWGVLHEVGHADLFYVLERDSEGEDERRGGRPTGFALVGHLLFLLRLK